MQSTADCMNVLDFSGLLDASAIAPRSVLMALTMAAAFASVHGIRMVSVNIPGTARQRRRNSRGLALGMLPIPILRPDGGVRVLAPRAPSWM